LALNHYNQLPIIQDKQKEYLKSIKSSTINIDDETIFRDEEFDGEQSLTKSNKNLNLWNN